MSEHDDKQHEPGTDRLDAATQAADAVDARQEPGADREPTPEEAEAAEKAAPVDEDVAQAYEEATKRGADIDGEGAVEVANDGRAPLGND